jgi:hypothetical protein
VQQALLDLSDRLVLTELWGQLEQLAPKGLLETPATWEVRAKPGERAQLVQLVRKDLAETLAQLARQVPLVILE